MTGDFAPQLVRVIERYDIGELLTYLRDERGFVNTSFTIQTLQGGKRQKYFFRRYKRGIKEEEIRFEHSVIQRLAAQGPGLVAKVVEARDGATFVTQPAEDAGGAPVYYAIFTFLEGEDKYTWIAPRCTIREIQSSARVLADFHRAVANWSPQGRRAEPKIGELLSLITHNVEQLHQNPKGQAYDALLDQNLLLINAEIERVQEAFRALAPSALPQLVIHCDYHPGNLKFQDEQVVGLFDFDWSKVDYRLFDVALALFYFFTDWSPERDGALRLDEVKLFLEIYQEVLAGGAGLEPLSPEEVRWLPWMIRASNLYVLNWGIQDYIHKEVDPVEYFDFLQHAIRTITWMQAEANWSPLVTLAASLA
ncbi:MAG: phosphotransferase [Anaerolineales bacterium]|nr:phosphotransferase [Anaerolineales bacterium]